MLVITLQACNADSTSITTAATPVIPITGATDSSNLVALVPTSLPSGSIQQGGAPVNLPEKLTDQGR